MEPWQRDHIIRNLSRLINDTNCTTNVLAKLQEKGILSSVEIGTLISTNVPIERSQKLYTILQTRTDAYDIMQQILTEENQNGVAEIFRQGNESVFGSLTGLTYNKSVLLGKGSSKVYEGKYGCIPVAVKVISCEDIDAKQAQQEVQQLVELLNNTTENIVRYFCSEEKHGLLLIALELCKCNLAECIQLNLYPIEVTELRQITKGLHFLHTTGNGILHLDLKPQNILVKIEDDGTIKMKIADFGISKKTAPGRWEVTVTTGKGTFGWMAPELLRRDEHDNRKLVATTAADIFSLGCVYYYVISGGKHPFGDKIRCSVNILDNIVQMNTSHFNEAVLDFYWLIRVMISQNHLERPRTSHLLNHLVYWSSERKIKLIVEISFLLENNIGSIKTCFANYTSYLRNIASAEILDTTEWTNRLCPDVKSYVDSYLLNLNNRLHSPVEELFLIISKLYNNYTQLPEIVRNSLGDMYDDFLLYWTSRFPFLLSTLWTQFDQMKAEPRLEAYYNDDTFCNSYKSDHVLAAISESFQKSGMGINVSRRRNLLVATRHPANLQAINEDTEPDTNGPVRQDSIGSLLRKVHLGDEIEIEKSKTPPMTASHSLNLALEAIWNNEIGLLGEACNLLEQEEKVAISKVWRIIDKDLTGSLLHFATREGRLESVRYLVEEKGFDAEIHEPRMYDLLHVCVKDTLNLNEFAVKNRQAIVEIFLRINDTLLHETMANGETPMHMPGIHFDLLAYLIHMGGKLDAMTLSNKTVLHTVANSCGSEVYFHNLVFMINGENMEVFSATSKSGRTPLHYAMHNFEVTEDTLELLKSKNQLDLNARDNKGNSVFLQAVIGGRSENYLKLLFTSFDADVEITDFDKRSALHLAAMYGNVDALEYFIEEIPQFLVMTDCMGRTPLHCAFLRNHETLLAVIQILVESGVQVNARTHAASGSKSALHLLIELTGKQKPIDSFEGVVETLRYLIEHGAEIGVTDNEGNTILHLAFEVSPPEFIHHLTRMKELMSKTICSQNKEGSTPLHKCFSRKDVNSDTFKNIILEDIFNNLPNSSVFYIRNKRGQSVMELVELLHKNQKLDDETLCQIKSFSEYANK